MSHSIEQEGATVEEAVKAALHKLNMEEDQVDVEVLREPTRGFLGLGAEKALIRATPQEAVSVEEEYRQEETHIVDERVDEARTILRAVLDTLEIDADIEVQHNDDQVLLSVAGADGLGLLIGKRGETLSAIQAITTAATRKYGAGPRVVVDIEGYRQRRLGNIEQLARRAAEKAATTGREVSLGPMNSFERRIVHVALKDNPEVFTRSEGEDPDREVIIIPR